MKVLERRVAKLEAAVPQRDLSPEGIRRMRMPQLVDLVIEGFERHDALVPTADPLAPKMLALLAAGDRLGAAALIRTWLQRHGVEFERVPL